MKKTNETNQFELTPEEENVRMFLALNVWGYKSKLATISVQQLVADNGMRSARRFSSNGVGTILIELAEYEGLSENNRPGGPEDAKVFARTTCRNILEAAKWIHKHEREWLEANA